MENKLEIVKKAIGEKKGVDAVLYDFRSVNPFVDHVVICSAPSLRQVYAIADNVADRMKENGYHARIEGSKESKWVLLDLDTIIVHVFSNEERDVYKLEKLYADLPCEDFSC